VLRHGRIAGTLGPDLSWLTSRKPASDRADLGKPATPLSVCPAAPTLSCSVTCAPWPHGRGVLVINARAAGCACDWRRLLRLCTGNARHGRILVQPRQFVCSCQNGSLRARERWTKICSAGTM
jgi:hypothetical protein